MKRKLEICCTSIDDALAAERGGADRIELCEELWCGGVTPDDELITAVVKAVGVPVFVLIRPRGGDFVNDEGELREMVQTIAIARDCGATGIVSGSLTRDGVVDQFGTRVLIEATGDLPFTFHRAFDEIADQSGALEELRQLGVHRVLTSAAADLVDAENSSPILLACGGLRSSNVSQFAEISGLLEFHSAASLDENGGVSEGEVRAIRAALEGES